MAIQTPMNLVLTRVNGAVRLEWQNYELAKAVGFKVERNNVLIATISQNSTIIRNGTTNDFNDSVTSSMTLDGSVSGLYKFNLDKTANGKIVDVTVNEVEPPTITVVYNTGKTVVALNNTQLTNINYLDKITCSVDSLNLLLSADNGATWKSWNTTSSTWQTVNINDINDVVSKANPASVINSLTRTQLEQFRSTNAFIKIAYYIKIDDTNKYQNSTITIQYTTLSSTTVEYKDTFNITTGDRCFYVDETPPLGQTVTYKVTGFTDTETSASLTASIVTPLPKPTLNASVDKANSKIKYTWDAYTGADGYKLYITGLDGVTATQDLTTTFYDYTITKEDVINAYLVVYVNDAVNGVIESSPSDTVVTTTYPINNVNNITYTYKTPENKITVNFIDASVVEDNFNVEYWYINKSDVVQASQFTNIVSTTKSTIGTSYSFDLPLDTNHKSVNFKISTVNSIGSVTNAVTLLKMPPVAVTLNGTIDTVTNKINYTWNSSLNADGYKLVLTTSSGTSNIDLATTSYTYNITKEETVSAYVIAYMNANTVVESANSNTIALETHPQQAVIDVTYTYDATNKQINVRFKDTSTVEDGFKVEYFIDGTQKPYIDIPSTTTSTVNTYYNAVLPISTVQNTVQFSIKMYNQSGVGIPTSTYTVNIPKETVLRSSINTSTHKIDYNWDAVTGVTGYKLYLDTQYNGSSVITTSNTNHSFDILSEDVISAYVITYITDTNGTLESDQSNTVSNTTYPLQVVSNISYTYESASSRVVIDFTDTSKVEKKFRVFYTANSGVESYIDVASTSTTNTGVAYRAYVPVTGTLEKFAFYIATMNDVSYTGTQTSKFVFYNITPPVISGSYNTASNTIDFTWNSNSLATKYRISVVTSANVTTNYEVTTNNYSFSVPSNNEDIYRAYVRVIVDDAETGVHYESDISDILTYATYPTQIATNLEYWYDTSSLKAIIRFRDNSKVEKKYRIYYKLDDGAYQYVDAPTTSTSGVGGIITKDILITQSFNKFIFKIATVNDVDWYNTITQEYAILRPKAIVLNATLDYDNDVIRYTWDAISGATGYRLFLTDSSGTSIQNITTNSYNYNIVSEGTVTAYAVTYINDAQYGYYESDMSNTTYTTTYPVNIVNDVRCTFNADSTNINISFVDISKVETGFKIYYQKDNGAYSNLVMTSTTTSTIGTTYTAQIPIDGLNECFTFYIKTFNDAGQSKMATSTTTLLTKPRGIQFGYVLGNAKFGWFDNTQAEQKYRIFYKINNQAQQAMDVVSTSSGEEGKAYTVSIPLDIASTIEAFICAVDGSGNLGIPSPSITTSFATYTKEPAPTDFNLIWASVGIAEFSWTCNSDVVQGYKLEYEINDGDTVVVDFPCIGNQVGTRFSHSIPLTNDRDTVKGTVHAYTIIDNGLYTEQKSITYIVTDKTAPKNFWKSITDEGYLFTWDTKNYIDGYEVHYTFDGVEHVENTINNYFVISNYKDVKSISIYVMASFSTLEKSEKTNTIVFAPTLSQYKVNIVVSAKTQLTNSVNTKIMYLKAKTVYYNIMATTNRNVKTLTPPIVTKSITYQVKVLGYYSEISIAHTKYSVSDRLTIMNRVDSKYNILTRTIRFGDSWIFRVQTATVNRNTFSSFKDAFIIYNNSIKFYGRTSSAISNINIEFFRKAPLGIFFERVSSGYGSVGTTIWTFNKFIYGVYTEIHKIRICTLGDSITAGHPNYWAENEKNNIPNSGTGRATSQYQYWLQKRLMGEYEVLNNGYGSDTTERMLNRFDKDIVSKNPQYCIIQGGTNDINWAMVEKKGDQAYLDDKMATARQNIVTLVNKCFENHITPIVGTLIPRTSAQGIYRQAIWDYNRWIINYCNSRDGLYYADFYNAGKNNMPPMPLEEPTVAGNLNPLYDGDSVFDTYGNLVRRGYGVHPNDVGYKLMAEAVPLNIFQGMKTGIKLYVDEKCTVEENNSGTDIYKSIYNIAFNNLDRGRVKTISRYIKNIGNQPVLFTMYVISESGIDMQLSLDGVNFSDRISGRLENETVNRIYMRVTVPRTGVLPTASTVLSTRSIKVL